MTTQQLIQLSNIAVVTGMLVLTLAMVFFAASFAGRRAVAPASQGRDRGRVTVAVAAGVGSEPAADPVDHQAETGWADASLTPAGDESPGGRRAGSIAMMLTWLAFVLLAGAVAARALWAGRAPWGNMYEFSVATALAALAIFLLISTRRDVRWFGVFLVPAVLLTLGVAVLVLYTESAQLVPALDSYWLVIHVAAAVFSSGAFIVAGLLSALYLFRDTADRRGGTGRAAKLPAADRLDMMAYRTIAFTMPLWTFAVVAGAIWAEAAWGRYWGWDPKETWALVTWLIYAGYLHARATAGWRGRRAAWLGVMGLVALVFNYFVVNLVFQGLHSYAGV